VLCEVRSEGEVVQIRVAGGGRLPEGFDLAAVPAGVSGLGLVRALLPRRGAQLALENETPEAGSSASTDAPRAGVVATLRLQAPSVRLPDAAPMRPTERPAAGALAQPTSQSRGAQ
jgi:hypothetical protein